MNIRRLVVTALLCLLSSATFAGGRGVAILPVENVALATSSPDAAKRAIMAGAARRGWVPSEVPPNVVQCRLVNRQHVVVVDIHYTANSFSVRYNNSANMDYDPIAGTIHRKYNMWVANLVKDIQVVAATIGVGAASAPSAGTVEEAPNTSAPAAAPATQRQESKAGKIGRVTRNAVADIADAVSDAVRTQEKPEASPAAE